MHIPKVSVVIPVYKVEQYLRRCVDSVLAQTLSDLEIILVDDGSPDHCPEICDEYATKDTRIHVIHQKNSGPSSARNAGMDFAHGQYLVFVDSDDYLETDGIQTLYSLITKYNTNVVRNRAFRTNWPNMEKHSPCMLEPIREILPGYYDRDRIRSEIFPKMISTNQLTMGAMVGIWSTIYDMHFIRSIGARFDEKLTIGEDMLFWCCILTNAKSMYFCGTPGVYHHCYNVDSLSNSFSQKRWTASKQLISSYEEWVRKQDSDYDFSKQLQYLRWFCILLSLNERRNIHEYLPRCYYCKAVVCDPVVVKTKLRLNELDIPIKQKFILIFIKLKLYRVIARM